MSIEISQSDQLFKILRTDLLWHCTSPDAYRSILRGGAILPAQGSKSRWGNRPYACQTLGAVCLFDFFAPAEEKVLKTINRWSQFIVSSSPVTVIVGVSPDRLPGRLVRHPENRDTTSDDSSVPIPYVEVCHVGAIPVSAFETHLLVCSEHHRRFRVLLELTESVIEEVYSEYGEVVRKADEIRVEQGRQLQDRLNSPEFKHRVEIAQKRCAEFYEAAPSESPEASRPSPIG